MRRSLGLAITLLIILQLVHLIPNVNPDNGEVEWIENHTFEGSCSMDNIYKHFQVNRTVVEITVHLTWVTEGGWANLDMWMQTADGHHVEASSSEQMPEVMGIREFPNRGRWTVVITPKSCGGCGYANYTLNITMRNIILPKLEVSASQIEAKDNVTMYLNSTYEHVSHYFFDFGDGTDSGWINQKSISKIYNSSGEYYPKAKVQYSDGTESDWVEVGSIEVNEDEKPDLVFVALVTLVILILITALAFFTFKKRKGF